MKRLNAKWIGKYGGYQKAFKTPVLEEGLKYKGITSTHQDMEFIQQRKITREEILAAYGVPPAIVGLFEYANYANSREQKKLFWEDTMLPKLIKMQEYVSVFLLPQYGPRLVGEFDLTTIQALQESDKNPEDKNPEDESPGDGEDVGDGDNFDFSKTELKDLVVSLRKRFRKRIKES